MDPQGEGGQQRQQEQLLTGPEKIIKQEGKEILELEEKKMSYKEIPVKYRNRIGVSKVSGTVKGSIFAGIKILTWIFKYSFK